MSVKLKQGRPVGLYDSGLGGLSVLREVKARFPDLPWVYVGDTARVPYGGRPEAELIAFNREILGHLADLDVQAVVMACNTSSAVALDVVASQVEFPVLGMIEAGVRAALTRGTRIGVLATEATIRSQAHARSIARKAPDAVVHGLACPAWVPLVESGRWEGAHARSVVEASLAPWMGKRLDAVILGCTHYPFLAPLVREVLGSGTVLVDPAQEVVRELAPHLEAPVETAGTVDRLLVTGDPERFQELAFRLVGPLEAKAEHLSVQPGTPPGVQTLGV